MSSIDFHAIAAVVHRFFASLDAREHAVCAGLMAGRGAWHRQGKVLAGPAAVLAALEERDPLRQTAHVVTNLWIEEATPGQARVRFYLSAYEGADAAPRLVGIRSCTDDLVSEGGQWRIALKTSRRLLPGEMPPAA